jgi:hypothetical protein
LAGRGGGFFANVDAADQDEIVGGPEDAQHTADHDHDDGGGEVDETQAGGVIRRGAQDIVDLHHK